MSQRSSIPDCFHFGALLVQHLPHDAVALFGARQRGDEIVLSAEPDRPADATQDPIDLSISPVSIEIKHRQSRCLSQQFFVCHWHPPHNASGKLNTTVREQIAKKHSSDTFVSIDVACAVLASVPHHDVKCSILYSPRAKSEATSSDADAKNSEFVVATPDEAPAAVIPPPSRTRQAGAATFAIGTAIYGDASC